MIGKSDGVGNACMCVSVTVSPSMLLLLGGRTNAESDNATAERDVEAKAAA